MTCKTIAVANQKGGTGKTATTLSLGIALAKLDKRVLLVDTDPQGDLTKSLGWSNPDSLEITVANHIQAVIDGIDLQADEGITKKASISCLRTSILRAWRWGSSWRCRVSRFSTPGFPA